MSDYALLALTIAKITESLGRPVKIVAKLNPFTTDSALSGVIAARRRSFW